jgi:organic radical activating enzyme
MVIKMIEEEIEELIEKAKDIGIDVYYPRELLINSILNKTKEDIMIYNKRKSKIRRFIDNITNNDKKKLREKYMELKNYGYNTTLLIE